VPASTGGGAASAAPSEAPASSLPASKTPPLLDPELELPPELEPPLLLEPDTPLLDPELELLPLLELETPLLDPELLPLLEPELELLPPAEPELEAPPEPPSGLEVAPEPELPHAAARRSGTRHARRLEPRRKRGGETARNDGESVFINVVLRAPAWELPQARASCAMRRASARKASALRAAP